MERSVDQWKWIAHADALCLDFEFESFESKYLKASQAPWSPKCLRQVRRYKTFARGRNNWAVDKQDAPSSPMIWCTLWLAGGLWCPPALPAKTRTSTRRAHCRYCTGRRLRRGLCCCWAAKCCRSSVNGPSGGEFFNDSSGEDLWRISTNMIVCSRFSFRNLLCAEGTIWR